MKRAVSLVIALAMIFAMIPFAALAVGTGTYADPEIIEENGKYTATFEEGGGEYYYLWTATAAGTLSVTADSENTSETYDIDVDGFYLIADHDSSTDEEGDSVVYDTVIDVVAGDKVEICVFDEDASEIAFHVEFNTLAGTEENPLLLYSAQESQVEIPAGQTVYYRNTGNVNGMVFTLTGSDVSVAYNGTTYAAADGKITFSCTQSSMNEPCNFAFTNTGSEDATYTVIFAAPEGTWDNPAELPLGSNTATVAAGTNGYYYTYTAAEEGILTITMAEDNANGWFYSIVNQIDYSSTADHFSTPTEGDPVFSDSMEMHAGDYVIVLVNTYEAGNTSAPAGSVNFIASFEACEIDTDEGGDGEEGGEVTDGVVASGEAVAATVDEPILVEYTPETDGILTVVISGTPGYKLTVHDANDGTVGLPKESSTGAEQTVTYELSAGMTYTIRMVGYAKYDEANGSITYTISFKPSEITEEEEAYIISSTDLVLGENTLTLEAGAKTTLYEFTPAETGTYGFSGPFGSIVGYWGGGSWWLVDPQADSFYCEQTITSVGQSAYIGVSGEDLDGEFTLTVTKVADYSEVVYNEVKYQNKATLSSFQLPEDAVLGEYVDVSTPHTAVLGDDGYYHLDSADGDILLIDMDYKDIILTAVLSSDRPVMYAYVKETDGSITKYDIIEAIQAYEAVKDADGYYPLTEDLVFFYDVYANGVGTWSFHLEEGTYDADTVWMYCCRTISGLEGGETEDPDPVPSELNFQYRYGTNQLIQVNTNLPASTPIVNFTAGENGCSIDQSANQYQQVGWIQMDNADGTVVLTFHFNAAFDAGQNYILPAGAVFGFTDGNTYTLDKDYVFTWDGSSWTVSNTLPDSAPTELTLQYYAGANNVIGVATNLPSSTPCVNFLATDNGCSIDQSGNPYQQVGYIEMRNQDGIIGLLFHFNAAFEAGQYYILPADSVFGFTDGKTYPLDKDYVFVWDGSSWTVTDTIPEVPADNDGSSRENAIPIQHGDVLNVTLTADNAISGVWYVYVAENENPLTVNIDAAEVENYSILYLDAYINDSTTVDASDDGQKLTVSPAVGDAVYVCVNVPEGDAATATLSVVAEQPGASETTAIEVNNGAVVTVPAGQTVYYIYQQPFGSNTYILDVTGNTGFAVTNAGNAVADSEGAVSATVAAEGTMPTQFYFAITNNTEEEQSYNIGIAVPVGTMSNPDILNIGENSADVAGDGEAYFYNWTAMEEGTLTLTMNGTNWTVAVNNMTTGVYGDTISGADGVMSVTVEVEAYDGIEVVVGTADNTAATVTFTAEFQGPQAVAKIGDVAYFTVYDALYAAVSGDTVTMLADSDESTSNLFIDEGVTLDLGVYDLHAKSVLGISGSTLTAAEYGMSDDWGKLYVASAKYLVLSGCMEINDGSVAYLPVWDPTEGCYVIGGAAMSPAEYALTTTETDITFLFKPAFRRVLRSDLFTDDQEMRDNGLTIVLRLTWQSGTGTAQQDFVYSSEFTKQFCVAGSMKFGFNLSGYDAMYIDLEGLTITPMIVSDNGFLFCGPTITGA